MECPNCTERVTLSKGMQPARVRQTITCEECGEVFSKSDAVDISAGLIK